MTKVIRFAQYRGVARRKEGCRESVTYWIKCVSYPALSIFHCLLPCDLIIFYLATRNSLRGHLSCDPLHLKLLFSGPLDMCTVSVLQMGVSALQPVGGDWEGSSMSRQAFRIRSFFLQLSLVIKGNGGFRESFQYFSRWSYNTVLLQSCLRDISDS